MSKDGIKPENTAPPFLDEHYQKVRMGDSFHPRYQINRKGLGEGNKEYRLLLFCQLVAAEDSSSLCLGTQDGELCSHGIF